MSDGRNLFLDCYATMGLTESPFKIHALRANEMGKRLLVGRDEQMRLVAQRLHKHGKITCLDGHVGVGKTSLVNVAAYECFHAFLRGETPQLLIPLQESFQLTKDEDVNKFSERVFYKVAQGLISQSECLRNYVLPAQSMQHVNAWLNSPVVQHLNNSFGSGVTVGIPGVVGATLKADGATSNQINTSTGFSQAGLEQLVRRWLDEIFSVQGNGGVVCVIDNLELLESGVTARRMLEALRDRLFDINGLRWVFCGANGVVHSLAASPRLGSYLNTPIIEVQNIKTGSIEQLVRTRLQEFSIEPIEAEGRLPIRLEDLTTLYTIINFNLRDLLGYADEYCEHQINIGKSKLDNDQKAKRFVKWLEKSTTESYRTLSSRAPQDAWTVLDVAMSDVFKGTFGIGDYGSFSSNSKVSINQATFEKWLRVLVKLGLISRSIEDTGPDDDGFKRDIFSVTAKGAMIHYARIVKNESQSLAPLSWLKRVHF